MLLISSIIAFIMSHWEKGVRGEIRKPAFVSIDAYAPPLYKVSSSGGCSGRNLRIVSGVDLYRMNKPPPLDIAPALLGIRHVVKPSPQSYEIERLRALYPGDIFPFTNKVCPRYRYFFSPKKA